MSFSIDDILNSPCGHLNQHLKAGTTKGKKLLQQSGEKKVSKGSKIKDWIGRVLATWSEANSIEMRVEYKFHGERRFRFDWCFPSIKLAIEYEGIVSDKSRHTSMTGYSTDSEKYNLAQSEGWRVLRYTALNHKNLANDLNKILNS